MRNYHVLFLYGTDLRADVKVEAGSDLIALAYALHEVGQSDWIEHPAMRVEIRHAEHEKKESK